MEVGNNTLIDQKDFVSLTRRALEKEAHGTATHGSLCPKGAVAERLFLGILFHHLLLPPHGCPRCKRNRLRRRSCGLYNLRKPRTQNVKRGRIWQKYLFSLPHERYGSRLFFHARCTIVLF